MKISPLKPPIDKWSSEKLFPFWAPSGPTKNYRTSNKKKLILDDKIISIIWPRTILNSVSGLVGRLVSTQISKQANSCFKTQRSQVTVKRLSGGHKGNSIKTTSKMISKLFKKKISQLQNINIWKVFWATLGGGVTLPNHNPACRSPIFSKQSKMTVFNMLITKRYITWGLYVL